MLNVYLDCVENRVLHDPSVLPSLFYDDSFDIFYFLVNTILNWMMKPNCIINYVKSRYYILVVNLASASSATQKQIMYKR